MDIDVLQHGKDFFMPYILNVLSKITLPDMEVDDFTIQNTVANLYVVNPQYVQVGLDSSDNAILLTAQNLGGVITGDFKYKLFLIEYHGHFEADIQTGGAQLSLGLPLIANSYNGKLLPSVQVEDMNLLLNPKKIDIKLSGSIVADIADLFVDIFSNLVVNIISSQIEKIAPDMIVQDVNAMMEKTGGAISIPELGNLGFDFSYTATPVVLDGQIDFYVNGTVFNGSYGEVPPPGEKPADIKIDQTTKNTV